MAGLTDLVNPFAAVGAGASAAFGIINGVSQGIKANRLERNNIRPIAQVNNNYLQNTAQAEQMARGGLASRVYNNAINGLDTGLTAGLRFAGRSGGVNSVASILRGYGAGVNNLNAQDQQAQQQNQRLLLQQRGILAQDQQRVWNFNKANPFMERAQQVASLRNSGNQNIFGGIQALGNVAGAFAGGGAGAQPSTMTRVDAVNNTIQGRTYTGNLSQSRDSYLNQQLQNSLRTGYGMNPFTRNV